MNKVQKASQVVRYVSREGEGALVDATFKPVPGVSGRGAGLMTVDISTAPVPDKRYVADMCSVDYSELSDSYRIFFGQLKFNGNGALRSLLVVQMSSQAVEQFMQTVKAVDPSFHDIATQVGCRAEKLGKVIEEPAQTVAFAANVVLAAMSGREACMDFYHASPFAIGAVAQSKKLAVEPVVRVDVRSSLAIALFDELALLVGAKGNDASGERG